MSETLEIYGISLFCIPINEGGGGKNPKNSVYIVYGCSLGLTLNLDVTKGALLGNPKAEFITCRERSPMP